MHATLLIISKSKSNPTTTNYRSKAATPMQMSVLSFPSNNRNRVIKELLQGKEYATQLKFLLLNQNPIADHPSAKELLTNVLRSFANTLSVITSSSESVAVGSGGDTENLINSGADSNNDLRSEDSTESKKRLSPTAKDRRGSYKRRKTEETRSNVSETIEDNHAWRKYGQKEILNSPFPRSYFRCTRKHDQGCRATKQVQRIQENPDMYQITYIGYHTCNATVEAPNMLTFSDTNCWDSFLVNSKKPESRVPIEVQNPPITPQCPTVKQEYPNEASNTPSGVTDNLDPNMWSDLKDFELSKPAKLPSSNVNTAYMCSGEYQNLEKEYYGVFSSDLDLPF